MTALQFLIVAERGIDAVAVRNLEQRIRVRQHLLPHIVHVDLQKGVALQKNVENAEIRQVAVLVAQIGKAGKPYLVDVLAHKNVLANLQREDAKAGNKGAALAVSRANVQFDGVILFLAGNANEFIHKAIQVIACAIGDVVLRRH